MPKIEVPERINGEQKREDLQRNNSRKLPRTGER